MVEATQKKLTEMQLISSTKTPEFQKAQAPKTLSQHFITTDLQMHKDLYTNT